VEGEDSQCSRHRAARPRAVTAVAAAREDPAKQRSPRKAWEGEYSQVFSSPRGAPACAPRVGNCKAVKPEGAWRARTRRCSRHRAARPRVRPRVRRVWGTAKQRSQRGSVEGEDSPVFSSPRGAPACAPRGGNCKAVKPEGGAWRARTRRCSRHRAARPRVHPRARRVWGTAKQRSERGSVEGEDSPVFSSPRGAPACAPACAPQNREARGEAWRARTRPCSRHRAARPRVRRRVRRLWGTEKQRSQRGSVEGEDSPVFSSPRGAPAWGPPRRASEALGGPPSGQARSAKARGAHRW
jgi:hypothetical protein